MEIKNAMLLAALEACEGNAGARALSAAGLHRAMQSITPISMAEAARIVAPCIGKGGAPTSQFAQSKKTQAAESLSLKNIKELLSMEAPTLYKNCRHAHEAAATMLPFEKGRLPVDTFKGYVLSVISELMGEDVAALRYDVEHLISVLLDPEGTGYITEDVLEKTFSLCEAYSPIDKAATYVETKSEAQLKEEARRTDIQLGIGIPRELA